MNTTTVIFQPPTLDNVTPLPRVTYETVYVTPDRAREWLTRNTHNRPVKQAVVEAYARDVKAGDWSLNGEAIKFAADGTLLDGQHRLLAVIEAQRGTDFLVVRGLDASTQDTMDAGAVRKYGDQLRLAGESNSSTLAAACRRVWLWEQGQRTNSGKLKPTHSELAATIGRHPELRVSAEWADAVRKTAGLPGSILALTHFLFSRLDPDDAGFFLGRVCDGVNLPAGHPALAFRERVRREREQGGRIHETALLGLLVLAWNAYRAGESRTRLQLPRGGLTPSTFPEPR